MHTTSVRLQAFPSSAVTHTTLSHATLAATHALHADRAAAPFS